MPDADFPRSTTRYQCPFCGTVTHNPHDIGHRYCAACHVFQADVVTALEIGLAAATRMQAAGPVSAVRLARSAILTCDRAFNEETP
jgi:ribosomal protein L37AE/L43A